MPASATTAMTTVLSFFIEQSIFGNRSRARRLRDAIADSRFLQSVGKPNQPARADAGSCRDRGPRAVHPSVDFERLHPLPLPDVFPQANHIGPVASMLRVVKC